MNIMFVKNKNKNYLNENISIYLSILLSTYFLVIILTLYHTTEASASSSSDNEEKGVISPRKKRKLQASSPGIVFVVKKNLWKSHTGNSPILFTL